MENKEGTYTAKTVSETTMLFHRLLEIIASLASTSLKIFFFFSQHINIENKHLDKAWQTQYVSMKLTYNLQYYSMTWPFQISVDTAKCNQPILRTW